MSKVAPAERHAVLVAQRDRKMARSAHAYVRGNTAQFYDWLAAAPVAIPDGPPVWICGDCHLGNLGAISDGGDGLAVQIRDLDQAVIGNPAFDLIRLGLSLATAARGADLPGIATVQILDAMLEGYAAGIADPVHGDPGATPDAVKSVRRRAAGRRWKHLAKERLDGDEPELPRGKKFWDLEAAERDALGELFTRPDVCDMVLSLNPANRKRRVRLVDAAYWMKGCSSLGLRRYAVLLALDRTDRRADYALVDIKEAVASVAPADDPAAMPNQPAERVRQAACALSPFLGGRLLPVEMLGGSFFIRELAPQDLKIEVEQFSRGEAVKAARYLAFVVGVAHSRQMDASTREGWAARLAADTQAARGDTPTWLWRSVVVLAGQHESGYLDHCRRVALAG
ncbi:DUF2252 family protein [Sphingomonas dokdonensis]|uniref:DUF2252 family protein n=1 Tax=Sphingomonas dokdonensis TaxID=344880 RepID=UPI000B4C1A3D|nr:DUF2252 family protein [Sphingomonas dokdonensis]